MRSAYLSDAISELSSTTPDVLTISASSSTPPYFALESSGGPFGDSIVEFSPDSKTPAASTGGNPTANGTAHPAVTETFAVSTSATRVRQRYKFSLIRRAARAMALASKVSIRGDVQGVLSLQFMIEVGNDGVGSIGGTRMLGMNGPPMSGIGGPSGGSGGGKASFVDFRFVPLLDEEDEEESTDV